MRIKEIRLAHNMTQKQLADILGIDFALLSKYENGRVKPSQNRLNEIAEALCVEPGDLIDNSELENETFSSRIRKRARSGDQDARKVIISKVEISNILVAMNQGICDLCGAPAPFKTKEGRPYLEMHYIQSLAHGGYPSMENIVMLCPNCKKKMELLNENKDIEKLKEQVKKRSY